MNTKLVFTFDGYGHVTEARLGPEADTAPTKGGTLKIAQHAGPVGGVDHWGSAIGPGAPLHGGADNLGHLWIAAGGDPRYAAAMAEVARAESSGNPRTVNPESGAAGLWQIYGHGPGNWLDPMTNARKAVELWNEKVRMGRDPFEPWYASRDKWGPAVSRMQH